MRWAYNACHCGIAPQPNIFLQKLLRISKNSRAQASNLLDLNDMSLSTRVTTWMKRDNPLLSASLLQLLDMIVDCLTARSRRKVTFYYLSRDSRHLLLQNQTSWNRLANLEKVVMKAILKTEVNNKIFTNSRGGVTSVNLKPKLKLMR